MNAVKIEINRFPLKHHSPLSFKIFDSSIISLKGPSQCGKSSLAQLLASKKHSEFIKKKNTKVGLCPQHILSAFCKHQKIKQHIFDTVGFDAILQHLSALKIPVSALDTYPHQVSIGQLKRIAIMIAMLSTNDVVILDECLSSLDHANQLNTLTWIRSNLRNKSVVIIHHQPLPKDLIDHEVIVPYTQFAQYCIAPKSQYKQILSINNVQTPRPINIQNPINLYHSGCSVLAGESGSGKSSILHAMMLDTNCHIQSNITNFRSKSQLVFQDAFSAFIEDKEVHSTFKMPDIDQLICQHILKHYNIDINNMKCFKHCSGGTLQVLQLARAIARKPEILLLDEPTSAMHLEWRNITYQLLAEQMAQGLSILMVTHNPHEVKELASHHYELHRNNQRGYTCIALS